MAENKVARDAREKETSLLGFPKRGQPEISRSEAEPDDNQLSGQRDCPLAFGRLPAAIRASLGAAR